MTKLAISSDLIAQSHGLFPLTLPHGSSLHRSTSRHPPVICKTTTAPSHVVLRPWRPVTQKALQLQPRYLLSEPRQRSYIQSAHTPRVTQVSDIFHSGMRTLSFLWVLGPENILHFSRVCLCLASSGHQFPHLPRDMQTLGVRERTHNGRALPTTILGTISS